MAGPRFWTPVVTRLGAIATGAHGTDRVVPAGAFTIDVFRGPGVDGDEDPDVARDRRVAFVPQATAGALADALNPYSGENARRCVLEARVGYRYDLDPPLGGTTADLAAAAHLRAVDDWEVLARALTWPPNWSGLVPSLYNVQQTGEASVRDDGAGRVTLVAPLLVEVSFDPATAWGL